jgi:hypothetical protein
MNPMLLAMIFLLPCLGACFALGWLFMWTATHWDDERP